MYEAASKKWAATFAAADQDNTATVTLRSTEPASVGAWAHLALSYDANLKQVRLYVNGQLSAAQAGVTSWNGTGPLECRPGEVERRQQRVLPARHRRGARCTARR